MAVQGNGDEHGWRSRIAEVAIIGGGYMGGGIAQTFALGGMRCHVWDVSAEQAKASVERLRKEGRRLEELGLFPAGASELLDRNLVAASSVQAAVGNADYITEAVPENLDVKRDVLQEVESRAPQSSIIASNTSAIPIKDLAAALRDTERFLGVHWMNPAFFVPCVEVIPSERTLPQVLDDVVQVMRFLGKAPTPVSDSPGFIANRLQYALFKECTRLVEEGVAAPQQIDEVVRNSFGFRLPFFGPFAIADIAGLDVYLDSFRTMEAAFAERMRVPTSLKAQVERGRLGLKSGSGFHEFQPDHAHQVATYRDRAYAGLKQLRAELGAVIVPDGRPGA